jgi:hypothetical protein
MRTSLAPVGPSPDVPEPPLSLAGARLDTARQEITRLRAENATVREQAARHLG